MHYPRCLPAVSASPNLDNIFTNSNALFREVVRYRCSTSTSLKANIALSSPTLWPHRIGTPLHWRCS